MGVFFVCKFVPLSISFFCLYITCIDGVLYCSVGIFIGSSTSNDVRKKGRGPALGYQGKEKIKIIFNEHMQPIGDSSTDLANLLGGIAKCGARAPLNIVTWKSMPDTNLELMWRDVQV